MRLFGLVVLSVCVTSAFAQCIDPSFSFATQVCSRQNVTFSNTTVGEFSYEWDFCAGDLETTPESFNSISNSNFSRARSIRFVRDGGLWYAFAISATGNFLIRLDFGTDLQSAPAFTNLGNISTSLSSAFGFDVVKHEGTWHVFVANGGAKNLVRLSFPNGIKSSPVSTTLETPVVFDAAGPNFIRIEKDMDTYYGFVTVGNALTNTKVIRLNFGTSILNSSPALSTITVAGSNTLRGISLIKECNQWIGFTVSTSQHSVYRLYFGASLDNTPVVTTLNTAAVLNTPVSIEIRREKGEFYAFIMNSRAEEANAALYRLSFGNSIMNTNVLVEKIQKPELTGGGYGLDIVQDDSQWTAFTFNLTTSSLVKYKFADACNSSSAVSSLKDPPPFFYPAEGEYQIVLYATDLGGNVTSQLKSIQVSALVSPDIDFAFANICSNHDMLLSVQNSSGDIGSYNWDFGDSHSSTDREPGHEFRTAGSYNISLEVTGTNSCSNSIVKKVEIYDPPSANFTVPDAPICTNNDHLFTNSTTDNYDGNLQYKWFIDGILTGEERNLNYSFSTEGNHSVKLQTSLPGCSSEKTVLLNDVPAGPLVGIDISGACEGSVVRFSNATDENIASYRWALDDAFLSADRQPEKVFTPGTYTILLEAVGINGCTTAGIKEFQIHPNPIPDFATTTQLICENTLISFIDETPAPSGYTLSSWSWHIGDGVSAERNPNHAFSADGDHEVVLIVGTDKGCYGTTRKTIAVEPQPAATFSHTSVCVSAPVTFTSSAEGVNSWLWKIGDKTYVGQKASHTFRNNGEFDVALTVTGVNGCQNSVAENLVVPVPLQPDFDVNRNCVNETTEFIDATETSAPISEWNWNLDDEKVLSGESVSIEWEDEGEKVIKLEVVTATGCRYSTEQTITILPAPIASFHASQTIGTPGTTIGFTNTSTDASGSWDFGDGSSSSEWSPSHVFNSEGLFNVILNITTEEGCEDQAVRAISISQPSADIEILGIATSDNPDGSIKVIVSLENAGNTILQNLEVEVDISDQLLLTEVVEEAILPGSRYNLVLSYGLHRSDDLNFLCAEATLDLDTDISDNRHCIQFADDLLVLSGYPNPVTDYLAIEWISVQESSISLQMLNSQGVRVRDFTIQSLEGFNHHVLDVSGLSGGVYLLILESPEGKTSQRIVVSN